MNMKKIVSAVAVACCVLSVAAEPAFAISHQGLTNIRPADGGTYVGEGLYLDTESSDEGEYKEGQNSVLDAKGFSAVKKIAIAPALYSPKASEPDWKSAMAAIDTAAEELKKNQTLQVITYDEIADKILRMEGEDITKMNRRQATKIFRKYVADYADAYVEFTITNGSKTCDFFVEVRTAGDNHMLYNYKTGVAGFNGRDIAAYTTASKSVFRGISNGKNSADKDATRITGIEWNLNK